jgi:hypothetical protein
MISGRRLGSAVRHRQVRCSLAGAALDEPWEVKMIGGARGQMARVAVEQEAGGS